MKAAEQKATAALVRAAMRVHHYRERFTERKKIGSSVHRLAHDGVWDKLDELEAVRDAACKRLASVRSRDRAK